MKLVNLKLKNSSTEALLDEALRLSQIDAEADERWDVVFELLGRDPNVVFVAAQSHCSSEDDVKRQLGADLLRVGWHEDPKKCYPRRSDSLPILVNLLDDPAPKVAASAIYILRHLDAVLETSLETRFDLADHGSANIRHAMAYAMGGLDESPAAISLLIKLTQDEDADIRNWATFGLGHIGDADSSDIRDALIDSSNDLHDETRAEAILSLARRRDERALQFVKKEIESDNLHDLVVAAAGLVAAPELVEPLEAWREWWDEDTELLDAAIRKCAGTPLPDDLFMFDYIED